MIIDCANEKNDILPLETKSICLNLFHPLTLEFVFFLSWNEKSKTNMKLDITFFFLILSSDQDNWLSIFNCHHYLFILVFNCRIFLDLICFTLNVSMEYLLPCVSLTSNLLNKYITR